LIKTKVCPDFVFFPNAFTPNGDGRNDIYKPFIGGRVTYYDFSIYNRYGQIVFKTNNPAKGWDGSFNRSNKPILGSFVWVCKYQFANQPLVEKKGMCTLIR
jgi:gliding motility-associated-like protein